MKIGLVIYGSLETVSGGYIYDRFLVNDLRACGHTVEIVSLPWRTYTAHLGENFSHALFHRLRHLNVDVLLQDELCHPSLWRINRRLRGTISYPILALVHHLRASEQHPAALRPLYRRVEQHYLQNVDGFIFNSQTTKLSVAKFVEPLPPHVLAYPGGDRLKISLNDEQIKLRVGLRGPLRILFLGSITRRKQPHLLLQACSMLDSPNVQITLIGSQQPEPRYARYIQALSAKLSETIPVKMIPALDANQLPHYLSEHDLLVVPSTYEGFGIVYLEGMAFGLPAIATTAGAARETIRHGENGYLIEPHDADALAWHIQALLDDRNLLLETSLTARNHYENGPTWAAMSATVNEFLARIRGKSVVVNNSLNKTQANLHR